MGMTVERSMVLLGVLREVSWPGWGGYAQWRMRTV